MTRTALWIGCIASVAAACDGGGPGPADIGGIPSLPDWGAAEDLEIGTADGNGEPEFVPFTQGATVALARGGQGGFHVNLHARVGDAPPFGSEFPGWVYREARRVATGELVSRFEGPLFFNAEDGGSWQSVAPMQAFLCPPPVGIPVLGELLYVRIEVRNTDDPDGPLLYAGTAELRPGCPPGSTAVCRQVCDSN